MLNLHYTITPQDIVFPDRGRPKVRIRELPDGTCRVTNIGATHVSTVPSMDRAIAMAERILRIVQVGGDKD